MKKHVIRSLLVVVIIVFVVTIFTNMNNSYSINNDFVSISMYSDKHISNNEKVFVKIDGNINKISNIEAYLKSNKKEQIVTIKNINNKPYFEIPKDVFEEGDKIRIVKSKVKFNDNNEVLYTNSDGNYIQIDNSIKDSAWRDFTGIILPNDKADYDGNYYIDLIADTKEIVNITVNLTGTEDLVAYVENLDYRPFITIGKIGEYSIKDFTIYYRDGGTYTYDSRDKNATNYIKIDNNKIIVSYLNIKETSKNIEQQDYESTSDTTKIGTFDSANYIWIFILFVLILAAVVLFYLIKNEE